jgi:hypothetical protein
MPTNNIVKLHRSSRPKTFTAAEEVIEELSVRILESRKPYRVIAAACDVNVSTIHNIASRKTRWPRPHTLFSLLAYFNLRLRLTEE